MRGRAIRALVALLPILAPACGRVGYELRPSGEQAGGETSAGGAGGRAGGASRDASAMDVSAAGGVQAGGGFPNLDSGFGGTGGARRGRVRDAGPDVVTLGCGVSIQPIADYCLELPQLPAPPTIDGELDCGLALHPLTQLGWTGGAVPPDAMAEYAVAWRFDGLYFYVLVKDPLLVPAPLGSDIWEGDGIELFVDDDGTYAAPPAYDNPGTRQFPTAAPSPGFASTARGQVWSFPSPTGFPMDWRSTIFRSFPKPGGYALEAFVVGADLGLSSWSLSAGAKVGMDIAIDVSYPEVDASGAFGHRLGQYFLSVDRGLPDAGIGSPYVDTLAFCNPRLVAR